MLLMSGSVCGGLYELALLTADVVHICRPGREILLFFVLWNVPRLRGTSGRPISFTGATRCTISANFTGILRRFYDLLLAF